VRVGESSVDTTAAERLPTVGRLQLGWQLRPRAATRSCHIGFAARSAGSRTFTARSTGSEPATALSEPPSVSVSVLPEPPPP
jgi:hypothetical protein